MDDAQNVSFEFELLNFSQEEISKTMEIIDRAKLVCKQAQSDTEGPKNPTEIAFVELPRMAKAWEKVIEDYLKFIEIVQCYLVYFQIRYLLKNNLHPLASYLKLTFMKRFLKQPLFRFLLLYLVHSKISDFNVFYRVKYHFPLQEHSRNSILKYLQRHFSACLARARDYLKMKTQSGYSGEKLSIREKLDARFARIAAFFAKKIPVHEKNEELLKATKSSQIFKEKYFFEEVENKIYRLFAKHIQNSQTVKAIKGIHTLFCIDYKLKFQERSIDFVGGEFSADFGRLFLGVLRNQKLRLFFEGCDSLPDKLSSNQSPLFLRLILVHRMISISTQLIFPKWNLQEFGSMISSFLFSNITKESHFSIIDLLYQTLQNSSFMGLLLNSHVKTLFKSDQDSDRSSVLVDNVKSLKFLNICEQLETLSHCLSDQSQPTRDCEYKSVLLLLCLPQFITNVNSEDSHNMFRIKKAFKQRFVDHFQSQLMRLLSEHRSLEVIRICSKLVLFFDKFQGHFQGLDLTFEIKQVVMSCLAGHLRDVCIQMVQTLAQVSFFKVLSFKHRRLFLSFLRTHCSSPNLLRQLSHSIFGNQSLALSINFTNAFFSKMDYFDDPSTLAFFKSQGGANWFISQLFSLHVQRLMVDFQLVLEQDYQTQLAFTDQFTSCVLVNPDFWFDQMCALVPGSVLLADRQLERAFLDEIRGQVVNFNRILFITNSSLEGVVFDFKRGYRINQISFARKIKNGARNSPKSSRLPLAKSFQLTITTLKHFILENHFNRCVIKTNNLGLSLDQQSLPVLTTIRQFIEAQLDNSRKVFKPQMFFGDCDIKLRFTRGSFYKYFGHKCSVDTDSRVLVDNILKIEKFSGIVLLLVFSAKLVPFARFCSLLVGQLNLKCAFLSYLVSQRILRLSVASKQTFTDFQGEFSEICKFLMHLSTESQSKAAFSIDPRFIEKIAISNQKFRKLGLSGSLTRSILLPPANQLGHNQFHLAAIP